MSDNTVDRELKVCCATFYESDAIRMLIGDSFHPGGLDLTYHLGDVLKLDESDTVLDIASGRGASAVHLAASFGCHVWGIDYSAENVAAAKVHAAERGVDHLTTFREGDAEKLPFDDGAFDVVMSECSFCTFPNKETAAKEMARVVRINGRVGITDMTVSGSLPEDIQSILAWIACITGAGTPKQYADILAKAGFTDFFIEDHSDKLLDMVNDVRGKLMGVELAAGLGKIDLGDLDLSEGERLAQRSVELIDAGLIGYTLITGTRTDNKGVN